MGYKQAGFEVMGVDIEPQPHYPFEFYRANVLDLDIGFLREFDAVAASPPCQAHTMAQRIMNNDHPDLIEPTRKMLKASGLPYVIENVVGAPLIDPITLCGSMFKLKTYRHRNFECSFPIKAPKHPEHVAKTTKMGRAPKPGEFMHVVGNFSGVEKAKEAMGIDWMVRDELREAIPPAYTRYIGRRLIRHIQHVAG